MVKRLIHIHTTLVADGSPFVIRNIGPQVNDAEVHVWLDTFQSLLDRLNQRAGPENAIGVEVYYSEDLEGGPDAEVFPFGPRVAIKEIEKKYKELHPEIAA
jgi:hypothetical protein